MAAKPFKSGDRVIGSGAGVGVLLAGVVLPRREGERVVDDAVALVRRVPPVSGHVLRGVVDEGDQLEVGAVAEDNQAVFGLGVAVAAAGRDGEVGGEPTLGSEKEAVS